MKNITVDFIKNYFTKFSNVPFRWIILHLLITVRRKKNVDLYPNDGIGILQNSSRPEVEQKRKKIIEIFKICGLNITVKANLKTVDFLDISLGLKNNTYQPYQGPEKETVYIKKHANHPPNILKELPKVITKRITSISCSHDIFDAAKSTFEQTLSQSGFNEERKYNNKDRKGQTRNKEKRKRRRKITWFNPPFFLLLKYENQHWKYCFLKC